MNSPRENSSPKYKNLSCKAKQSPIEIKEKMRKNYKNRVQNCRGMLLDKFRGSLIEQDLSNTLTEIYKSMFTFPTEDLDSEENEILQEIRDELVQEELDWWLKEYDNSQMENFDWSCIEQEESVICPICQKTNFKLERNILSCLFCNISIETHMTLLEIKRCILESLDKHGNVCNSNAQFTMISEIGDTNLFLFCENCNEMKSIM